MHAADAHDDRKWKRIVLRHGAAGYGALWWLIELMRREADLHILTTDLDLYAADIRIEADDLRAMVATALDVGLFQGDSERFTAPALVRDIEEFETKRDKWRTSKRQLRDNTKTSRGHCEDEEEEDQEEEEEEVEGEEKKKTLPALVKPKKPRPQFNPEGKTKYLDWVYLSTDQYKRVVKYYEEKGLDFNDFKEAVRELDRWFSDNPKKRQKRTDDAKALMGWPLDRALERRQRLLNTQAAERRLKEQAA